MLKKNDSEYDAASNVPPKFTDNNNLDLLEDKNPDEF
jgi:hypothetical protein